MARKVWIDFAAVRAALTFGDVLTHYNLTPEGGSNQLKIACPFHEDATPSCSINLEKHIFRCFGCEAKGNALEFIILMEDGDKDDTSDMHAAASLAVEMMGRNISEFGKSSTAKAKPAKKAGATKTAQDQPSDTSNATQATDETNSDPKPNPPLSISLDLEHEHPFLLDRNIDPELAEAYGIGFCNGGIMKGRIAIPIHNLAGELVAFAGRFASEEIPEKTERYRFPKKFRKSLELWNIHRAAAFEKRHLTLVEGYWSAIRLQEAGIPVAALMGTSLSEAQAKLVRAAGFKYTTLLLDGDDAGRAAADAAVPTLSRYLYTRILQLPDGVKPDTMSAEFMKRLS